VRTLLLFNLFLIFAHLRLPLVECWFASWQWCLKLVGWGVVTGTATDTATNTITETATTAHTTTTKASTAAAITSWPSRGSSLLRVKIIGIISVRLLACALLSSSRYAVLGILSFQEFFFAGS
jgi:hypothetical protein